MPTTAAVIYSVQKIEPCWRPDLAVSNAVKLKASTTFTKGMLLGELTATPGLFYPYTVGASDGTQLPTAIMPYDAVTDASSNATLGAQSGSGDQGQTYPSVDVWVGGYFRADDLKQAAGVGAIDATAVAAGSQLVLKQGLISSGVVKLI